MYKSPIELIFGGLQTQIEGGVMRAMQNVGVNVDKDELIKALAYDRQQYEKGYADGARTQRPPCRMCLNALVDDELTHSNDLSYHGIGENYVSGIRLLFSSGNRKPPRILVETHFHGEWQTVGEYRPRFCPNCGREIVEYPKEERKL